MVYSTYDILLMFDIWKLEHFEISVINRKLKIMEKLSTVNWYLNSPRFEVEMYYFGNDWASQLLMGIPDGVESNF